jgi:5-dehydro-4-deoxyglucarate dehydratase
VLNGVLFFPITPFAADDSVDVGALTAHIEKGLSYAPGAVFVACGTGEFHALAPEEFAVAVRTAVDTTAGRVPVYAGVGGALGISTQLTRNAADAGADGLLLMPPYLVDSPQRGLTDYVKAVAASTDLPIIVYHRSNAQFTVESAVEIAQIPNVIGFKDGVGDLDLMARILRAVEDFLAGTGKEFQFFNGLPTAEVSQVAYRALGIKLYSSSTFAVAPDISVAFYQSLENGDTELTNSLTREYFHPLVRLRDRVPGYAVSLIKAGAELDGVKAGHVRPPLVNVSEEDRAELSLILAAGRTVLADRNGRPAI